MSKHFMSAAGCFPCLTSRIPTWRPTGTSGEVRSVSIDIFMSKSSQNPSSKTSCYAAEMCVLYLDTKDPSWLRLNSRWWGLPHFLDNCDEEKHICAI